jgi:hypothetical protein
MRKRKVSHKKGWFAVRALFRQEIKGRPKKPIDKNLKVRAKVGIALLEDRVILVRAKRLE